MRAAGLELNGDQEERASPILLTAAANDETE